MIAIKNGHELEAMRQACKITAAARALAGEMVRPGVRTKDIDKAVHDFIVSQGAKPSFLGYHGYPGSACISVNSTVIHGIPGGLVLKEGDIVSIDVGAYYKGFHGDCAATFPAAPSVPRLKDSSTLRSRAFLKAFASQAPDTECPISPTPFRRMWSLTVFQLCVLS